MHAATETERRPPVPRVTLYVRDSDAGVWDRARALSAGSEESLSSLATEGLAIVVERRERQARLDSENADRMEQVELEGVDWHDAEKPRRLRFVGVVASEQGRYVTYITRAKKVVLEYVDPLTPNQLAIFDSFDDFKEQTADRFELDPSLLTETADALGEDYYEEIE